MLQACAMGFGGVAMRAMAGEKASEIVDPLAPKPCHFSPSGKSVIFLYMDGGPSHVDTFDYKPALEKYNGRDPRKVIGKLAPTNLIRLGKFSRVLGNSSKEDRVGLGYPIFSLIWPRKSD